MAALPLDFAGFAAALTAAAFAAPGKAGWELS
jgi:hypothetical protein